MSNSTVNNLYRLKKILRMVPKQDYFKLRSCYNLTVDPSWEIEKRCHDDFHLLYVRNGKGYYYVDGNKIDFEKGKIIFMSYRTKHWGKQDIHNPPTIIPVRFRMHDIIDDVVDEPIEAASNFSLVPRDITKFDHLFSLLFNYYCSVDKELSNTLCNGVLITILAGLIDELNATIHRPINKNIERTKKIIDANPNIHYNVKRLANEASLSEKYYSKKFREQYDLSVVQYQINNRIQYAKYLLENTTKSIKEISFDLGYTDQYSFSKQFKKQTGISPQHMRG